MAHVRQPVIGNLSPERLRRLGQNADRIAGRIDSPSPLSRTAPGWPGK